MRQRKLLRKSNRGRKLLVNKERYLNECDIRRLFNPALLRKNAENLKQIFPEKEYRGLSPNFHIHVSVRKYVDRSWEYKSLTDT